MFVMNPEFQRNLRLQFSMGRLLAAPLIVILLLLVSDRFLVMVLPFVVGALWAPRLAAGAVLDEIRNRTWDAQRRSTLSVWSMTWGKLLGSVSYIWYCLFWFLALSFLLDFQYPWALLEVSVVLVAVLFAQVTAFFVGILFVGIPFVGLGLQLGRVTIAHVAAIIAVLLCMDALFGDGFVSWHGETTTDVAFISGSMLLFSAWGIFGAYRLLRLQLGYRNLPWAFLSFQLFLGWYLFGSLRFSSEPLPWILCSFSAAGVMLFYFALLWDEMSLVQCQRFVSAWRRGNWKRTLAESPISVVALLGVLFFALPATLTALLADREYGGYDPEGIFSWLILSDLLDQPRWQFPFFLFLLRDAGLFWAFNLRSVSGRGKGWGLIVVLTLHIGPYLAATQYAEDLPSWFWFAFQPGPGFSYAPVLAELFLVGAWLGYEWRRAVARHAKTGACRELSVR